MLDRLNPWPILRGHLKGLSRGDRAGRAPDVASRIAVGAALLLCVPAWIWSWTLAAPEALLAGVALLAGALLSAFGFLATARLRLQDRDPRAGTGTQRAKDLLDEAVAHLLAATLACLVDAVVLVVGMNLADHPDHPLTGWTAAGAIALSGYIATVFLILVTRLYSGYVDAVRPRDQLNGLVAGGAERT